MKEKVYINIKGLQLAAQNVPRDYEEDEDDPVEVINVGRYRIINGKNRYIRAYTFKHFLNTVVLIRKMILLIYVFIFVVILMGAG